MSDEQNVQQNEEEQMAAAELDALKDRATKLGVTFHPNIGYDKLLEKVKLAQDEEVTTGPANAPKVSEAELQAKRKASIKKRKLALVRVNVTCMNPNKREWEGEIFCVSSRITGTVKKMVPFGVDFHIPVILLDMINERECQVFTTVREDGKKVRRGKMIKEYNVVELPPLTKQELSDLAQRQAMSNGTAAA